MIVLSLPTPPTIPIQPACLLCSKPFPFWRGFERTCVNINCHSVIYRGSSIKTALETAMQFPGTLVKSKYSSFTYEHIYFTVIPYGFVIPSLLEEEEEQKGVEHVS